MNEKKQMMMIDSASAEALLDRIDFLQNKILPELKEITDRAEETKKTNKELKEIQESIASIHKQSVQHIEQIRFVKEEYNKSISNMQSFFKKLGHAQIEMLDKQTETIEEGLEKMEENQAKQLSLMDINGKNIEYFYNMAHKMVEGTYENLYKTLKKFNKDFTANLLKDLQSSLVESTKEAIIEIKRDQEESLQKFVETQKEIENIRATSEKNLKRYGKYLKIFNIKALVASFAMGMGIGMVIVILLYHPL